MEIWVAALWALVGGLCVEALDLHARIRRDHRWSWRQPIPQGLTAYLLSVILRGMVGASLAAAAAGSHQVSGALAAFGIGVAAPLIMEKLARQIPLTGPLPGQSPEEPQSAITEPKNRQHTRSNDTGSDGVRDAR
jgi:hypothetical protein